jgi:hypothetical protein
MRLPEAKIKRAILHPESEIRLTAVGYFADSHSSDPEVMPLVIEAVEKYGRDSSFRLLRDAEHLVQTANTLDWLINELRRDFEVDDIDTDNLRFALGLIVVAAPINLLGKRKPDIDGLAAFPAELRGPLDERLQMANCGWQKCWEALEELGRRTMKKGDLAINDDRHASRIIESNDDFRGAAADILEKIHSDRCVEECLDFLDFEDDLETGVALVHALLSHFSFEAIEPVKEFFMIDEDEWSVEHFDLLYHYVASVAATKYTNSRRTALDPRSPVD